MPWVGITAITMPYLAVAAAVVAARGAAEDQPNAPMGSPLLVKEAQVSVPPCPPAHLPPAFSHPLWSQLQELAASVGRHARPLPCSAPAAAHGGPAALPAHAAPRPACPLGQRLRQDPRLEELGPEAYDNAEQQVDANASPASGATAGAPAVGGRPTHRKLCTQWVRQGLWHPCGIAGRLVAKLGLPTCCQVGASWLRDG